MQLTPVELYQRAADDAIAVVDRITPDQLDAPTPCDSWSVRDIVVHLTAGADHLCTAASGSPSGESAYAAAVARSVVAMSQPGALQNSCTSPLGFEWTVEQAAAGTFMDTLIHTWDLATATGQPRELDPDLVDACVRLFLPEMPERGRAAGIVGPAVAVADDARAQDRLLGAMGRRP